MIRTILMRLFKLLRMMGMMETIRFSYQWVSRNEFISFKLSGIGSLVWCRQSSSDIHVLWQVFGMKQYAPALINAPRNIVDAGANVGYSSLYFAMTNPDAIILAIEPEPANCDLFRRNCRELPNITLLEAALWPKNEALRIQSMDAESWSFRTVPPAIKEIDSSTQISAVTMEDVIAYFPNNKIDFLKLDIEGSERYLIETEPEEWLERVSSISVECHDMIYPGTTERVIEVLTLNRFVLVLKTEEFLLFNKSRTDDLS